MFAFFKRKRVKEADESARVIAEASVQARAVLYAAIEEIQHDVKYTQYADDPELVARFFQTIKRVARKSIDEVLLQNADPFGESIKAHGSVGIRAGTIANGVRNQLIIFGMVDENKAKMDIRQCIIKEFEQLMDSTLQ